MGISAVILAAGEEKRMKPLEANVPKVMLPILGKPVLAHVLDKLIDADIKHIIIVVSPAQKNIIQKYFKKTYSKADIEYVIQSEPLGPAHAIKIALPKIKTDFFLVQYGDSLADVNIAQNIKTSLAPRIDGVIAVREVEDPSRYGIVRYDKDQVIEIIEKPKKPPSNHALVGTFILKTSLYKKATQNIKFQYGKEVVPPQYSLKAGGKLVAWEFKGKRTDVGKPEDLFNASVLLSKKPVKHIAFDADNTLYNSHQAAPKADLAAMQLLSQKAKRNAKELYRQWLAIVQKIKDSKDPKVRTREYSYRRLCDQYNVNGELSQEMLAKFIDMLLKNLKTPHGLKTILKDLKYDKYVLSDDIKQLAEKKLRYLGLRRFFKDVITSDIVGTMKPSRKFYETLLKKYEPEEILVVGDDYLKDLEIPSRLGMQVMFFEGEKSLEQLSRLKQTNRIHIMGAAGAGAAAVLGIAGSYGYSVSGCDINPDSPYAKNLEVKIQKGHKKEHLTGIDMLVISPAVEKFDSKNEELQYAKKKNIPILTWQKFQGEYLQKGKFVITVAGAYGKSTTTSMIAQILIDAGFDPTCEIGAKVIGWQSNFRIGESKYYVCESDEYNNNFLNYHPDLAIILNVGWDHPDFFKSKEAVFDSYKKFVGNIKTGGILIIGKDPNLAKIAKSHTGTKVVKVKDFGKYKLKIIGDFRQTNADAAICAAQILGIDANLAKRSIQNFDGVGRRLEYKGQIGAAKFYDDYAVQPHTILATSNALADKFKNQKILLVLEPHTFSRINTFFDDFIKSLKASRVSRIFITDVYASRERGNTKELSRKLAQSVGPQAKYTGSINQTANIIKANIGSFDVICSMGAGNSYKLYDLVKLWTRKS